MSKARKFIGILSLELADMQEDLSVLIDEARRNRLEDACTEYVFKENSSLYECEIVALRDIACEISARGLDSADSLAAAVESIMAFVPKLVHEKNYPAWTVDLVTRKVEKIRRFVKME